MNEKIKDILKKHKDWLEGESDGERASLIYSKRHMKRWGNEQMG